MRRFALTAAVAAGVALSGCASYGPGYGYNGYNNGGYYDAYGNWVPAPPPGNGYTYDSQGRRIATGAAVGAVGGAVAGAVLPGISPVGGAVAGAVLGGVLGAVVGGHQYYRDTRGYCYYVDQYGNPHYNYDVRC